MLKYFFLSISFVCYSLLIAQNHDIDLRHYELSVQPNLNHENIKANAEMMFSCKFSTQKLSLLLREELTVTRVSSNGIDCKYKQHGHEIEIKLPERWQHGLDYTLSIDFSGKPAVSSNPPWEAGFHWSLDHKDRSWMTVAPYAPDSAAWLPYPPLDQADSTIINIIIPDRLMGVSNGTLVTSEETERKKVLQHTFLNTVPTYPSEIQLGVGYYQSFDTTYRNIDGEELELNHYVQDYNLYRASKHFQQTINCYNAWEYYLGNPPFSTRKMSFIEVPFAGGPSSGIIRYGNRFMRGSYGGFIPRNMDWDHELVRSTAGQYIHQRFGYTEEDDRWIPIGINTYLEALFVEFHFGKKAALDYLELYRPYIRERQPLVDSLASDFELNEGDFVAKSGLVFHSIRQGFNDDGVWNAILREWFQQAQQEGREIENLVSLLNRNSHQKWGAVLEQYMHHRQLPVLLLRQSKATDGSGKQIISCKYNTQVAGFNLPLTLNYKDNALFVKPKINEWTEIIRGNHLDINDFKLDDVNVLVRLKSMH